MHTYIHACVEAVMCFRQMRQACANASLAWNVVGSGRSCEGEAAPTPKISNTNTSDTQLGRSTRLTTETRLKQISACVYHAQVNQCGWRTRTKIVEET